MYSMSVKVNNSNEPSSFDYDLLLDETETNPELIESMAVAFA